MSMWQKMTERMGGKAGRNGFIRLASVCAIMVGGMASLRVVESMLNWKTEKPYTPLRDATGLASIRKVIGDDRYVAERADRIMPADQVETLKTKEYLLRDYSDMQAVSKIARLDQELRAIPAPSEERKQAIIAEMRQHSVGQRIALNVNYYGTGGNEPHVPDICWTATGMERNRSIGDKEFTIKDVKLADGSVRDIPIRLLAFNVTDMERKANPTWAEKEEDHLLFVAYTFNVNGEYVASHQAVRQKFFHLEYPFAYHAKIEVLIKERTSIDLAVPAVEAFYRAVMSEVSRVLPDANELLAAAERERSGVSTMPAATTSAPATQKTGATTKF